MSEVITNAEMAQVSTLAQKQLTLERRIAEEEELLKTLKKELAKINLDLLPSAMDELGISKITLSGAIGSIEIREEWHASLAGEKKAVAIAWLRATNNDDIITETVAVEFGKGEMEDAKTLLYLLEEKYGYAATETLNVNTSRFKALCKELLEAGHDVPLDDVGIYVQRKAVVK